MYSVHPLVLVVLCGGVIVEDLIIIALILLAVIVGAIWTVKHFKAESGCCGSGAYKAKRKKLSNVIATKTFTVCGMHCKNCKMRVEELVGDIKGVSGKVNLKKGELTVSYAQSVDDSVIKQKLERAGYTLTEKK